MVEARFVARSSFTMSSIVISVSDLDCSRERCGRSVEWDWGRVMISGREGCVLNFSTAAAYSWESFAALGEDVISARRSAAWSLFRSDWVTGGDSEICRGGGFLGCDCWCTWRRICFFSCFASRWAYNSPLSLTFMTPSPRLSRFRLSNSISSSLA